MKKPHIDTSSFYKKKQMAQVLNTSFHRYKLRLRTYFVAAFSAK